MITLKTYNGQNISPTDDAIFYDSFIGQSGILNGCAVTHLGGNQIRVATGRMLIKGRMVRITDETIHATIPETGTVNGRLLIHMDLSNTEEPISFITQAAGTLPNLVQNENCNTENGIYELPIARYSISTSAITNFTVVVGRFPKKQNEITGAVTNLLYENLTKNRALVSNVNGKIDISQVSTSELEYLAGAKSNIQEQLNEKQKKITGGAASITTDKLEAGKALTSNSNGNVYTSNVTTEELNRLKGVNSNVQGQLTDHLEKIAVINNLLAEINNKLTEYLPNRQTFANVSSTYSTSNLLRNSAGSLLGLENNKEQSFIIICQYRGTESSPEGTSICSLKISSATAKIEVLASSGTDYPIVALNGSNNVYARRLNSATGVMVDVAVLLTRGGKGSIEINAIRDIAI